MKEKLPWGPSEFVLIKEGNELRLNTEDPVSLNAGSIPDHEQLTSFLITPKNNFLLMEFYYKKAYVMVPWGHTKTKTGSEDTEFSVEFSSSALLHEHDKTSILGTDMFFNNDLTRLTGKGWAIEHRPLLSS